jgi:hypothetical protein
MHKITLILSIFVTTTVVSQEPPLETRDKNAKYIPHEQLKPTTKIPKIKSIIQPKGFISTQVNVNTSGMNTLNDAANEPSLAVNPLNPNQIAVGWRQFDTISNSFRQAGNAYSTDGGISWNYKPPIEAGIFRSDPVLESNADGEVYYQSLRVDLDNQGNLSNFFVDQWKSYDGGANWVEKTFAYGGDKSWIGIDKSNGLGRGNIYAAWNVAGNSYYPSTFNHSIDKGNSYSEPRLIPRSPIFGTVDVGPDGELYIFGSDGYTNNNSYINFYLTKSINPILPIPTFPQTTRVNLGGSLLLGPFINPAGLTGQLYVAVDSSERLSRGNVYTMGSVNPFGADPLDIRFARSLDGGLSFTPSSKINTDTGINWQWFGTMSVAPNGRIDIIWYDTRGDEGGQGNSISSKLFYTYSYDAGISFAKEQAISPRFNNNVGYPVQQKMGDYIDMESDNNGAHIAYSATYNGEQDIYYLNAKPSAVEENPDFPTLLVNNAWSTQGVPRQGVLSTVLLNQSNPENQLLAFETLFTAKPDGTPIWLVATGELALFGDSIQLPLFIPTGDLSTDGQALMAIGLVTKTRLRDENNELIDNSIQYTFDMSDKVMQQVAELTGQQFNEDFYISNPFYNIVKTLTFNSLLPRAQTRMDLCNINGQVLTSAGEKSEGRLQYTYLTEEILNIFAADFTYQKTVDEAGTTTLVLDENGKAIPTWEVIQSNSAGVLEDNSNQNTVFSPNGGLGFFEIGDDPGITEVGVESISVQDSVLTNTKPNKTVETMTVLAANAYCGDY